MKLRLCKINYFDFRQCKVESLADAATLTKTYKQPNSQTDELAQALSDLNNTKTALTRTRESVDQVKEGLIAKVRDVRKKLDEQLDELEARTIEEIHTDIDELTDTLQHDMARCDVENAKLETLSKNMKQLVDDKKDNIADFITTKKCKQALTSANLTVKEVQSGIEFEAEFQEDVSLVKQMNSATVLGRLHKQAMYEDIDSATITHNTTYYATKKLKVGIRLPDDDNECFITGLCQMPESYIAVSDYFNQKVKLLNEKFEVVSHCNLKGNPFGLCYMKNYELAVCVKGNIISILRQDNGHLSDSRELKFTHPCVDIKCMDRRFYISSSTAIYMYTSSGDIVKKIFEDTTSIKTIYNFAFNEDATRIFISSPDTNSLKTIDVAGKVLDSSMDKKLVGPAGMWTSSSNSVFVCGQESNTVLQLDMRNKFRLAVVAKSSDGLKSPNVVLCYNDRLIIGQKGDNLLVFSLKQAIDKKHQE